jgi:plasmid stabilization system protein ParE
VPALSSPLRYEFHPGAEEDFFATLRFYRERESNEVARDFEAELRRCAGLLLRHPEMAPPIGPRQVRRMVLNGFPFNLHYVIAGEVIRILAVAHQSRRPGYWSSRL